MCEQNPPWRRVSELDSLDENESTCDDLETESPDSDRTIIPSGGFKSPKRDWSGAKQPVSNWEETSRRLPKRLRIPKRLRSQSKKLREELQETDRPDWVEKFAHQAKRQIKKRSSAAREALDSMYVSEARKSGLSGEKGSAAMKSTLRALKDVHRYIVSEAGESYEAWDGRTWGEVKWLVREYGENRVRDAISYVVWCWKWVQNRYWGWLQDKGDPVPSPLRTIRKRHQQIMADAKIWTGIEERAIRLIRWRKAHPKGGLPKNVKSALREVEAQFEQLGVTL